LLFVLKFEQFVVHFQTLDTEMLEKTKLGKILQRLAKKATNDSKTISQTILDNAALVSARRKADGGAGNPGSPHIADSPGTVANKEVVAGMKRARDGDAAAQPLSKKVAKASSKPLALQNAERRKAQEALAAKEKAVAASTATIGGKGKVAVTAPPKTAMFSALMSASKKPGTSIAARAAAAAKEKTSTPPPSAAQPKVTVVRDSPPRNAGVAPVAKTATASSFLGLLADMEKKPEKEVKKSSDVSDETEDQRARRLKKEARRKLRVTWKADAELVQTRLFTHDPDEEISQGDIAMRDAGDTGREGEMLKLHHGVGDLEDEEDEDSFEETEPYTPPSEVDFSVLKEVSEEDLLTDNGLKFGGSMKATSASSEAQEKHEQDTVMAVYTSSSDRPPTPKEPDDDEGDFEPAEPETPFGEPGPLTRQREKEYIARQTRLQTMNSTVPSQTDFAAQVQAISMAQTPKQVNTGLTPELQRALSMLGQPTQSTPTPQAATTSGLNLQQLLASVQHVTQQAPQFQAPPPTAAPQLNLGALLASFQQQQPQSQSQPQISLPSGTGGNPNPFPGAIDGFSRKHARTDSNDFEDRDGGNKKKRGGFGGDGTSKSRPYNYKTQTCSFWQQGKCMKGDSCTYRHGDE
jgi:hypothetical protein